jgi:antitoxin CptB
LSLSVVEEGRLRWKCRRGMKELDLLLVAYLDTHYPVASEPERLAFAALLEQQDPTLLAYVTGRERPASEEQRRVVDVLRRTP